MGKAVKSACCAIALILLAGTVSVASATPELNPVINKPEQVSIRTSAEAEHKLALRYDVYAGGFKALNALLFMDVDGKAYDMSLEAETEGFIGGLFPWKGVYNTSGHNESGTLVPSIHTNRSSWRDKVKITEMNYSPDGKVLKMTTQQGEKTTTNRDIDEKLSGNAVDLLSGALNMFRAVKTSDQCKGKYPVFDGKRRYNITLKEVGRETLKPTKYSTFEGEAVRCTVLVEPVAGFKKTDAKRGWMAVQKHTEAHNRLPTLWLARMKDSGQIVPVRMEIASDYGTVVAHLTNGVEEN